MSDFTPPKAVEGLLRDRYYQDGENWEKLSRRVASFAAQAEPETTREAQEERFYNLIRQAKVLPNSPALASAGVPEKKGSVAACFHFRPEDSLDSIMECRRLAGKTLQYGGGVGFELSNLRPGGSSVQSAHRSACGPIGTLIDYNGLGTFITQGGMRPAALMGILSITHPDVIKFIHCKENDKELANFNVSVSIPDSFMKKLAREGNRPHTCHFDGRQYNLLEDGEWVLRADRGSRKVLSVQDVWDEICKCAAINGDPGVYFVDTANKDNALLEGLSDTSNPYYFHGTNPCLAGDTELWVKGLLSERPTIKELYEAGEEVEIHSGKEFRKAKIIYSGKKETVLVETEEGLSLRCTPDHLVQEVSRNGFTVKNLCWTQAKDLEGKLVSAAVLNGGYATVTSVTAAGVTDVYDFSILGETNFDKQCGFANSIVVHNCSELPLPNRGACVLASLDLAKFVNGTELDEEGLIDAFKATTRMLDDFIEVSPWPDPKIEETVKNIRQIGPGVMGFTTLLDKLHIRYGSEACLDLIDRIGELKKKAVDEESKLLAEERGVYPAAREGEIYRNSSRGTIAPTGSLAMIADTSWSIEPHAYWAFRERRAGSDRFRFLPVVEELIPKEELEDLEEQAAGDLNILNGLVQQNLPGHMTLSRDLSAEEHINVVSGWQKWTDSSISKTIVQPSDQLSSERVSEIFQLAWENKLKGLTVYPEGSREGEPMSIAAKKKKLVRLPDELEAKTIKVKFDVGGQSKKAFIHVGFHPDNKEKPVQVFLTHPHEQDETFIQFISMMTRLVSLCLRYRKCPHCEEEALPIGQIIKQLNETDGQSMFSVPKILVEVLGKYLDEGEPVGTCPNCQGKLILTGRCSSCSACGWSKCG